MQKWPFKSWAILPMTGGKNEHISMKNSFSRFLTPPVFPHDEEKTRVAGFINAIVLSNIPILALFIIIRVATGADELFGTANLVLVAIIVTLSVVWILMRAGWVPLAGYLHVTTIWLASTLIALLSGGIKSTTFTSYFVVMLMAGLLLGWRPAIGFTILSILAIFQFATPETFGAAIEGTVLLIFGAIFLYLIISSLQKAVRRAQAHSNNLLASNRQLIELRDLLELRVQERTAALEKRATQLQIVASVARTIVAIKDIDSLLPEITRLVSEQFDFYHTGIFLVDEANDYAVLQAANSEGGRRMLDRHHRLRLDSNSIVGYATSRGEPRIALDVGADAVYFNNPDLPDTRSEMALPLRAGRQTIGALDVQSTETNAFSQEDISVLLTLADQVAIAIENARLFGESRSALSESQSTIEKYVKQAWGSFSKQMIHTGFVFDGTQVVPLKKGARREQIKAAMETGRLSLEKASSTIAIPLRLRGQTIGVLDVRSKSGQREWTRDEISMLKAAAERAALALENARLVDSAQRRAARERTIGEIAARIGTASNVDSIIQTAVEELGRKLSGAAEVTLELSSPNIEQDLR
ncbi:MAG TPA: GAF domain-containing protein [Anaerolineales bacterium]|nr:GAF domain-containing protein [Anaerolineales bacterium]